MENTYIKSKRILASLMIIMLLAYLIVPIASARASYYISAYSAGITAGSNGNITVSFSITGTGTMTEIGSTRIEIHENGRHVGTFVHTSTPTMMGSNKALHGSTVTYKGVAGRSYYAIVTYKSANSTGWDNRALQTTTITAKN